MSNCEWVSEWSHFSCVWLFATLWTVAHQTLLSMGFSRQEYWSGLPFYSPEDLPDPGIELRFPTRQVDSLPSEPPKNPISNCDALSIYLASQKKKKKKKKIAALGGKRFFQEKDGPAHRGNGRNRRHHACCCFYQGASSRWRDKAKQTAFRRLPNGPGHCCSLAKGRALL